MRLFLGVEIDKPVKVAAGGAAERLRQRLGRAVPEFRARFVPAPNLHITLWFIGEATDELRHAIVAGLQTGSFETRSFDLHLGGAGVFPESGRPRVLWLGVRRGGGPLADLYAQIGQRLAPLGFAPERRPYSAHVTIARVKESPPGASHRIRKVLADLDVECGESRVSAVTLFRSRLSPRGAVYEPLLRVPLKE